ncbi:hypothetical protein I3842_13G148200 [Carya illinoinensis]|uniref:DC1 domain-containing protein n=1 Tax=Carya illinoinensis TaxID=32201 RepID=A0A922AP99_CARIL|nr:hypothetical protein I3842_13G148200 [Carya illinoinensis]
MEIQHFSHEHPLVFIEGVGENEVIVCRGCDEPISDAAYKCSQYCSFFLHKSCTELQREIQHPVHPNHPLVLIASKGRLCDCCRKSSERCFVYHCGECDFDLDIKCASNWQSSTADDGHQHFTCDICGEDYKGYAHVYCAQLARTVQIAAHNHFLTLIFCLHHQLKEQDDQVLCQLCYKTVNTRYGAYYCKICDFVAHLKYVSVYPQYLSMDLVDSATNVTKEISPGEDEGTRDILEEQPFKLEDDNSYYSCATCSGECNIFIHDRCRNLPIRKQHLLHRHPLILSLANNCIGGTFICNGHQHSLRLAIRPFDEICNGCDSWTNTNGAFVCIKHDCNFVLDFECAILPLVVKYEYDRHGLLKLTYSVEDDSGEYYCFICEKERIQSNGFIIYPYIKYGYTFLDGRHLHPLTFVRKTQFSLLCDSCNETFEGMGIECKQCEFTVHPRVRCYGKLKELKK